MFFFSQSSHATPFAVYETRIFPTCGALRINLLANTMAANYAFIEDGVFRFSHLTIYCIALCIMPIPVGMALIAFHI